MQILTIGEFKTGPQTSFTTGQIPSNDPNYQKPIITSSDSEAIDIMSSGIKIDLLLCGPQTDMKRVTKALTSNGVTLPWMMQSGEIPDNRATTTYQAPGQTPKKSKSTGMDEFEDALSWHGSETVPLRLGQRLADMERMLILQTLTHCGGNRTSAADILGISSRTLRSKLQIYAAEGCTVSAPRERYAGRREPACTMMVS